MPPTPTGRTSSEAGPAPRYTSNRIFDDVGQNVFSERSLSQWAWTWGQFMDHTFGLAQGGGESSPMAFNAGDPLEAFTNDFSSSPRCATATASSTQTIRC
jgi:hypothetical protein